MSWEEAEEKRKEEKMDKRSAEMQSLRWGGIVLETFKVMRAHGTILASLTVSLVVPYSVVVLMPLVFYPLVDTISRGKIMEQTSDFPSTKLGIYVDAELAWLILGTLVYLMFTLFLSLVSVAAICYTVACIYTGIEVTYTKILSVVPKLWQRLMWTLVWWSMLTLAYQLGVVIGLLVLIILLQVAVVLFFPIFLLFTLIFAGLLMYLNMVWNMASVVSVLEDQSGSYTFRRSARLLQGKRSTSFMIAIIEINFSAFIFWLFQGSVVHSGGNIWERAVYATLLIFLLSALILTATIVQTVLYFTCKAYHHESLDRTAFAGHLDGYSGEYVLLKGSAPLSRTLSP